MIITHLAVTGVGRFRTRHVVRGLGPGLNLLCAPNETGKSTLFRAMHTGLFARHSSNSEDIRTLATLGAQLPAAIEIGFEHGNDTYRVEKSFAQGRAARLFRNGQPFAEGRRADEEIWNILGVAVSGRSVDESTFGLLWVRQGASFGAVESTDGARSALTRLIEAEVGAVLGGARGERVRVAVNRQIEAEETGTGRPRTGGNWKRVVDAEEAARSGLAEVEQKLALLDADLASLDARLVRQRELEDPAQRERLRTELAAARGELEKAMQAQGLAATAERAAAALAPARELAQRRHRDLVEADARIVAARGRLAELSAQRDGFDTRHAAQAATLAEAEAAEAAAAATLAEAGLRLDRLNRIALAGTAAQSAQELRDRLAHARRLREQIAAVDVRLASEAVTAAQLRRIDEADAALSLRRQQLAARAPQVRIEPAPGAGDRLRVEGQPVVAAQTSAVTTPMRIEIADIATIEIIPVPVPEDQTALEAAGEALSRELRKAGVATAAAARSRRALTEAAESERRALVAELAVHAPASGDADGVALLERRLAEAMAPLDGLSEEERTQALRAPGELAQALRQAEQQRDADGRVLADARPLVLAARSELAATDLQRAACRNELRHEQERLDRDLALHPDATRTQAAAALENAAAEAVRQEAEAEAQARALRAAMPSEDQRNAMAARVKRLAEASEGHERERQQLREEVAGLRERIATRGGEGLGERAALLREELALAGRDRARIENRLTALRHLRDTIELCRSEARDAYLAPIRRSIQPLLTTLFPGAEARMDDPFGIESLRRGGGEPEPFDFLSHGTREQIAVIVRLGLGSLLAARGQPTPVVLDDALVFSDDERIEHMFDVLTQAAGRHQVIVLTCRSRAFETLGGHRLSVVAEEA